jgi:predicted DNA-binding transcriptional regulator AlpA
MPSECPVSLDALLADPGAASEVSHREAAALLGKLSRVQALLVERLAWLRPAVAEEPAAPTAPALAAPPPAGSADDLLTVAEAATLLRVSPRWLYRHARTLPFARKLSRKVLRFSRAGVARWLATKRL